LSARPSPLHFVKPMAQGGSDFGRALFALGLSMLIPAAVVLAMRTAPSPLPRAQERAVRSEAS